MCTELINRSGIELANVRIKEIIESHKLIIIIKDLIDYLYIIIFIYIS